MRAAAVLLRNVAMLPLDGGGKSHIIIDMSDTDSYDAAAKRLRRDLLARFSLVAMTGGAVVGMSLFKWTQGGDLSYNLALMAGVAGTLAWSFACWQAGVRKVHALHGESTGLHRAVVVPAKDPLRVAWREETRWIRRPAPAAAVA